MARIEQAIYSILSASTAVNDQCSTRIYPNILPQNVTMPAVAYNRVNTVRLSAMEDDPDVSEAIFQISAFATSVSAVNDLADAIRKAMYRYTGSVASVTIHDVWLDDEASDYYSDIEEYNYNLDFSILYTETTS